MANLYLTHKCNRGCPFCFARKVLKESGKINETLSLKEIENLINHYDGQFKNFGLLGGEPFLYPELVEVIKLLKSRGITSTVFTSATNPMPEGLAQLDPIECKLAFVVNVGLRDTYNDRQFQNLEAFFNTFHQAASLSYTIFDLSTSPTFLFDLIDKYNLSRIIRTGIALPIYKGGNQYIPIDDYKKAGDYFIKCADEAASRGIIMNMDCGFIACMFSTSQIGHLIKLGGHVGFVCGAAIDIGPELKAWNCFPLFQLGKVNAMDYNTMEDLNCALIHKVDETLGESCGVLPECGSCDLKKRKRCDGGCRSFSSIDI